MDAPPRANPTPQDLPAATATTTRLAGSLLALGSAASFGASIPFVQKFGHGVGPFSTAAALGAGAALGALAPPTSRDEPKPTWAHARRLAVVIACGGLLGPVCLSWGLARTSSTAASLLFNLEVVLTTLLGCILYRERLGARSIGALVLVVAGGVVLGAQADRSGSTGVLGLLAVGTATLAWALDSALTRPLADLDRRWVVFYKATFGGAIAACLAFVSHEPVPSATNFGGLVLCGIAGYGMSLRLYLGAQRALGVARTASLFALAPFIGAVAAWALGDPAKLGEIALAATLFAAGVALQLSEPTQT